MVDVNLCQNMQECVCVCACVWEQRQYSQLTGSFLFRYEESQGSQLTCDAPVCVCVCLILYPRVNLCVRSFLVRYEQRQHSQWHALSFCGMKMASVLSAQGVCEWKMKGMLWCVELVGRCKAMQDPLTKSDTLTTYICIYLYIYIYTYMILELYVKWEVVFA